MTALAASSCAGLVAAGFERAQRHRRSSSGLLAIWRPLPHSLITAAPYRARIPGSSSSSTAGTQKNADIQQAGRDQIEASEAHAWQLTLVAELAVNSSPLAICWLDHLQAAAPAIAVAQGPASLTLFAQLPRFVDWPRSDHTAWHRTCASCGTLSGWKATHASVREGLHACS